MDVNASETHKQRRTNVYMYFGYGTFKNLEKLYTRHAARPPKVSHVVQNYNLKSSAKIKKQTYPKSQSKT